MYDTNTIDADQRPQVQELRLGSTLKPAERDRVEMILLSDAGWSPPAIATHLGYCSATTRRVLRGFQIDGIKGLRRNRPGPPPDTDRRHRVQSALSDPLSRGRT
ncbi:MAG TPA: helix-turn-helix domain-containing protein [Dehalococcoidia bacterium]|nr:helix-turn-helix domain-containing protein [Dehalococcoidia bacterium]